MHKTANKLSEMVILNNCKRELRTKVEAQIKIVNERDALKTGGALALYFIRNAVIEASSESVEAIQEHLKTFKLTDIVGENVDEGSRILRHLFAILRACNRVPDNANKKVMKFFTTSSNEDFNEVFEQWSKNAIITGTWPTSDDIMTRAITYYTSLKRKQKWVKSKTRSTQFTCQHDGTKEANTPSHARENGNQASSSNNNRNNSNNNNRGRSNRNTRRSSRNSQPNGGSNNSNQQNVNSGMLSGSPGIERIRTFTIDGIELKGDVSPPIRSEQHLARSFQRADGNGTIELFWCWSCGRGGMWKKHATYDCPNNRANSNNTSNNSNRNNSNRTQGTNGTENNGRATRNVHFSQNQGEQQSMASYIGRDPQSSFQAIHNAIVDSGSSRPPSSPLNHPTVRLDDD